MSQASDSTLISLILLCYNHERFIGEALDGVLAQTYAPLEIVVIDDCSPDRSAEVIADTLARDSRAVGVRFVRNPQNLNGRGSIERGFALTRATSC